MSQATQMQQQEPKYPLKKCRSNFGRQDNYNQLKLNTSRRLTNV